jgi:hypothetical protein
VEIVHDWAGFKPDATFNAANKDIVSRNPEYWSVVHRNAVDSAVERMKLLHDQHLCAGT